LAGILGTQAHLGADINIIFQLITFALITVSVVYKKKKKFKTHAQLMGVAIVMHIFSFIAVMGPVFFTDFTGFVTFVSHLEVQTMWIHVIPGLIAMILGTLIVVLWALNPNKIAACSKRKRIMDIIIILWLTSLIFGITTYTLFYI
jgi:uncharacterized membrane protein YozB (DUF420 family)